MKNPFGESERTISAGPKKREDPEHVGFCLRVPAGKPDPHLPAYCFLCIIVYFLRPCWGADMRGRIVNYIFRCSGRCGSGFSTGRRVFRLPPFPAPSSVIFWGVSEITDWYVKIRGCGYRNWVCEKGLLPDPSVVRIFSLFGPAEVVFQIRVRVFLV